MTVMKKINDVMNAEGEISDDEVKVVAGGTITTQDEMDFYHPKLTTAWCPFCKSEHEMQVGTRGQIDANTKTYYCSITSNLFYSDGKKYMDGDLIKSLGRR